VPLTQLAAELLRRVDSRVDFFDSVDGALSSRLMGIAVFELIGAGVIAQVVLMLYDVFLGARDVDEQPFAATMDLGTVRFLEGGKPSLMSSEPSSDVIRQLGASMLTKRVERENEGGHFHTKYRLKDYSQARNSP
jgi:hypothetical protein